MIQLESAANVQPATRAWCWTPTLVVIGVGLALRALLMPLTHGPDFAQQEADALATLNGINIYVHPPHVERFFQYAYFPLYLFFELPFTWLALHAHLSLNVMGKIPIIAGDVLAAILIASYLRERGHRGSATAFGTALYFLNPLVLYNGALYGRFDAVCVGLFLLALRGMGSRQPRPWTSGLLYAVAVAAKT